MTVAGFVARVVAWLRQRTPAEQQEFLRALLAHLPLVPISNAERKRSWRARGERNDSVPNSGTPAFPTAERPRSETRNERVPISPTPPPSLLDPNFLAVNAGNGLSKTGEYPKELQEIPELLRKLQAPGEFNDPQYWSRIDAWLGGNSGVFYLDELPKFLAHHEVQTGSKRHRNLRRAFRNWLAKSEYWSQRRAQTQAERRAFLDSHRRR